MQFLTFLLVFIAGSLFTVAIDIAAGKLRNARRRKAYELKARIIREYESQLSSWGTVEARGHGPWCTSTCSHRFTRA